MPIRVSSVFALTLIFSTSALAESLPKDEAVRLFLGIGNGSRVTAEKVEVQGNDVMVRNLFMPMPEAEAKSDGSAPKVPSSIKIQEMRFIGVNAGETSATFDGVSGSGILVSGQQGLGAKSLAFGPMKVKELGTVAFSIEGDLSFNVADIVTMTDGAALRVSSYALSFKGDPAEKYTQSVRIDGVRSDQWKTAGSSEGVQIDLSYQGDGGARTMDGSFAVRQAQFGEIKSRFSLVDSASGVDRLALVLGQNFLSGEPKLKSGSLSFNPSEQIRMLLMVLPSDQRETLVQGVSSQLSQKAVLPTPFSAEIVKTLKAFLANPNVVTVDLDPEAPVPLSTVLGAASGGRVDDLTAKLGVKIRTGL